MYDSNAELLTLKDIQNAYSILQQCSTEQYRRTPLITGVENIIKIKDDIKLSLKMENAQVTGSFKVRGTITSFKHLPEGFGTDDHKLITMSAGNYGKAFAYITSQMGLKGVVLMPDTAPDNRETLIKSFGCEVERLPTADLLKRVNQRCDEEGMMFMHPFDDIHLIAGHASIGMEIVEDVTDPDIVLVCCGGGGSLAGTAAAIKLSGHANCRIYGVEPHGSRTMYESFKAGHPVTMAVSSVAAGLSPPFAGSTCYRHCREFVEDILLVSDEEIVDTLFRLTKVGILVEPSGAAAMAALLHGKVPDAYNKNIVVVLTGGNVSPGELVELEKRYKLVS